MVDSWFYSHCTSWKHVPSNSCTMLIWAFVFHFYILGLMSWIRTNLSFEGLKFESPSKWNSYEGFNLDHWRRSTKTMRIYRAHAGIPTLLITNEVLPCLLFIVIPHYFGDLLLYHDENYVFFEIKIVVYVRVNQQSYRFLCGMVLTQGNLHDKGDNLFATTTSLHISM